VLLPAVRLPAAPPLRSQLTPRPVPPRPLPIPRQLLPPNLGGSSEPQPVQRVWEQILAARAAAATVAPAPAPGASECGESSAGGSEPGLARESSEVDTYVEVEVGGRPDGGKAWAAPPAAPPAGAAVAVSS
jgi:hypothetical protein